MITLGLWWWLGGSTGDDTSAVGSVACSVAAIAEVTSGVEAIGTVACEVEH